MGRVTLQTLADKVGVSRMTVSNAFSRPDQLSASLRTKILAAADELGYVGPDPAGRALASGTTGAVGILLTDYVQTAFADDVATSFLGAIADELAPTGLALTLLPTMQIGDRVPARDVAMDGALVYHCDPVSPAVQWLLRRRLPLVFVDQHPEPHIPSVNVDDRGGARKAAQHLVDLGHRRIGILTAGIVGPHGILDADHQDDQPQAYATVQRMRGWRDALDPAGVTPAVILRLRHSTDADSYAALDQLLAVAPDITAVLCFSDVLARGVLLAAADRGIRVPDDLSVVGFDDNPLALRSRPALTTVRQDLQAKGHSAAAALTDAIERFKRGDDDASGDPDGPDEAVHLMLPTDLVVRDSTAPPPARRA